MVPEEGGRGDPPFVAGRVTSLHADVAHCRASAAFTSILTSVKWRGTVGTTTWGWKGLCPGAGCVVPVTREPDWPEPPAGYSSSRVS